MKKRNLHTTVRLALKHFKRYNRKRLKLVESGLAQGSKLDFLNKRINRLKAFLMDVARKTKLATAAGVLALSLSNSSANAQTFVAPVTNPFGLTAVGSFAAPTVADLDGDGDMDMMVGENYNGDFVYYQNVGSAAAPSFAAAQVNPFGLSAFGSDSYITPTFADLDGDGDFDMMAGTGTGNGDLYYFQNTGTASAPSFAAPSMNPFGITLPGYSYTSYYYPYSTYFYSDMNFSDPALIDIDNDGDLDMLVGNDDSENPYYFQNIGTSSAPSFAAPITITGWANTITPEFYDFDTDGDFDMFTGDSGGDIYYLENTGTSSAPTFATYLLDPFAALTTTDSYTNVELMDLDNDGDMDIFAGASDGNIYYYEQCMAPSAPTNTTPIANLTVCSGQTTTLTASGTGTLSWYDASTGGTFLASGTSFTTPAITADTVFYVQDSTCSEGSRTAISITVAPLPDVTTSLAGITVSANLSGATSYQWVNCPSFTNASGTSTGQNYTASANGDYAVIITNGGCTDTSTCVTINSVGINSIVNENRLAIYPNPSNGNFTIVSTNGGRFTINNEMGQSLQTFELNSGNNYSVKIENLSAGIYFINANSAAGISRYKIVVTK